MTSRRSETAEPGDVDELRHLNARLKDELADVYDALEGWKKVAQLAIDRMSEAERLLWPNRFTSAKVKAHFEKWSDIDGRSAIWGGVDGRPENPRENS